MARILVFNNDTNTMETFNRGEDEAMPYVTNGTLRVGEFRGSSKSPTLWTDRRTMQAWNSFRFIYGRPIGVGYAFKRPWEGGHTGQSQHYAGTAFDVGQNIPNSERTIMRNKAISSGVWSFVEPASLTPTWVHFDRRSGPPACAAGGYPLLRQGSRGNYVLILQDSLNNLGYRTGGLDGLFGPATANSVRAYQKYKGLTADGIVGCNTWNALMRDVVGRGRTSSTID